jgi:hypothetical protein
MISLVINTTLLREIDERRLINAYARFVYNDERDISDNNQIKENLIKLLDWDKNGDNGLGIYCSKFESIKEKDWNYLINFIKENHHEIKSISYYPVKNRKLESSKTIYNALQSKEKHNTERFTSENYKVSGRGKKAKPCVYEGREYKSRQECMYKEGLTKYQIWKYLKDTNQI